jgi:hypothetical protein
MVWHVAEAWSVSSGSLSQRGTADTRLVYAVSANTIASLEPLLQQLGIDYLVYTIADEYKVQPPPPPQNPSSTQSTFPLLHKNANVQIAVQGSLVVTRVLETLGLRK